MPVESAANPDLQELYDTLLRLLPKLHEQVSKATSSDVLVKLLDEIDEVNFRLIRVGSKLFTQRTASITKAMDKVRDSTAAVNNSIANLDKITDFVKTFSSFLALVDKVIDTAKLVMPGVL